MLTRPPKLNNINEPAFFIKEKRSVTVMMIDFSIYSRIGSAHSEDILTFFFNNYFKVVDRIVKKYSGYIDRVIGDTLIVVFGINNDINPELSSCKCGIELLKNIEEITASIKNKEIKLTTPIAIHSGDIYIFNYDNKKIPRKCIIGENINLCFKILDTVRNNDIVVSDSIINNISDYIETESVNHIIRKDDNSKLNIYKLKETKNFPLSESIYNCDTEYQRELKFIKSVIEKKNSRDRMLFFDKSNLYNKQYLFDCIEKNLNKKYFVFHGLCNSYNKEFNFEVFKHFYEITQFILYKAGQKTDNKLENYNDKIKEYFNFNSKDDKIIINKKIVMDSFRAIFKNLSKYKKIIIIIENFENLNDNSKELINYLVKTLKDYNVYYIFSGETKLNLPKTKVHSYKVIDDEKIKNNEIINNTLSAEEKLILYILSQLGTYVKFDLLKEVYEKKDIYSIISALIKKNILKIKEICEAKIIEFVEYNFYSFASNLTDDKTGVEIHLKIAEAYKKCYKHNAEKYYDKICYHYEKAENYENAIYYLFLTAIRYRTTNEIDKTRYYLLKAITFAEILQAKQDNLLYFSKESVNIYDYLIFRPFFHYKIDFRITLYSLYYFYSKTFTFHEDESLIFLEKSYLLSKKFDDKKFILLSSLHYFQYYSYMKKFSMIEYIEEAEKIAKETDAHFLLSYISASYLDIIFSGSNKSEISEKKIIHKFNNAKKIMTFNSNLLSTSEIKSISVLWNTYYSYFLKINGSDIGKINKYLKKAEHYLENDNDRIAFYNGIATGIGPVANTKYQLSYIKKAIKIAKKNNMALETSQYYSTIGYLYMTVAKYEKSLIYHLCSKNICIRINNIVELGMTYKNLGDLYNCLGNFREAEKCYKLCLKIKKGNDRNIKDIDFTNIVFPLSSLVFSLIKNGKIDEALKNIKEIELSMTKTFFGKEIPVFLEFLKLFSSLIIVKYEKETIDKMMKCYLDMKNITPEAIQLVWMKKELSENGVEIK